MALSLGGLSKKHLFHAIRSRRSQQAYRDEGVRLAQVAEESNERARMQEDRYRESQKEHQSA